MSGVWIRYELDEITSALRISAKIRVSAAPGTVCQVRGVSSSPPLPGSKRFILGCIDGKNRGEPGKFHDLMHFGRKATERIPVAIVTQFLCRRKQDPQATAGDIGYTAKIEEKSPVPFGNAAVDGRFEIPGRCGINPSVHGKHRCPAMHRGCNIHGYSSNSHPYQLLYKYHPCAEIILLLFPLTNLFMYVRVQTIAGVFSNGLSDPDTAFPLHTPVMEGWCICRLSGPGP